MKKLLLFFLIAASVYAGEKVTTGHDYPRTVIFYAACGMCCSFIVELNYKDPEKVKRMLWHAAGFAILYGLLSEVF